MAKVSIHDADSPLPFLGHRQAEVADRQRFAFAAPGTRDQHDVDRRHEVGIENPGPQGAVLLAQPFASVDDEHVIRRAVRA